VTGLPGFFWFCCQGGWVILVLLQGGLASSCPVAKVAGLFWYCFQGSFFRVFTPGWMASSGSDYKLLQLFDNYFSKKQVCFGPNGKPGKKTAWNIFNYT
jgi:hypothetical protein